MSEFRFLHAADIHLDSPLIGLASQEGRTAERVRTAPRAAFEQLVDFAVEERVDIVIIAGDLYDGPWRDFSTGLFFAEQMGRLNEAGVPVFLLYGNHDAESQITKPLTLPDNVNVFSSRKSESFRLNDIGAALHGQSFREKAVTENLVPGYPAPLPDLFNIGVLHTGLGGLGGHANYAPCGLEELTAKGYDYWALGHVHQRQVLAERPHIVFPGNLQGRHIRETGAKGATLVVVEEGEVTSLTVCAFDVVRWAALHVDVTSAGDIAEAVDVILEAIGDAANDADGRLLACRIFLRGASEIHDRLLADASTVLAEVRAGALGLGEDVAWIEKVVVETAPASATQAREEIFGDLSRMLNDADSDLDLNAAIESDIAEMVRQLPHDVRNAAEDEALQAAMKGDYPDLIRRVTPYLAARLAAEET